MEATSDTENSPTSASSASSGPASSPPSPTRRRPAALAEASGAKDDLMQMADYIFTRDE